MNPFTEARIVAVQASAVEYNNEPARRGAADYVVRSHCLGEILRNANRWVSGYKSPDSNAKSYGSLLDCLVLVPEQWAQRYVLRPDTYPAPAKHLKVKSGEIKEGDPLEWNANAAHCKEWAAQHRGRTPVSMEMQADITMAHAMIKEYPRASTAVTSGKNQVWVQAVYTDKATGRKIPVKGLIDIVPDGEHPIYGEWLFDLKTTRNASPSNFRRECHKYNYDLQAALYMDIYNAARPEFHRTTFAHLLQENYPPWETRVPILSDRFVDRGRQRYRHALALYALAQETGKWPGYDGTGDDWPVTEPEEWMLSPDQVLPGVGKLQEGEEEEEEQLVDLIP
jgi:hypothetical protein